MKDVGDYISREAAKELLSQPITMSMCLSTEECHHKIAQQRIDRYLIESVPAADVVPWEWLERYADYFCAGVSMPEFVREAKMFYEGTNEAMKGGVIDG